MTLSHAEARKLLPYLVPVPHESEGLMGLPNAAFTAANVPSHRLLNTGFDCGSGYAMIGGEKRWVALVDAEALRRYAGAYQGQER